MIVQLYYHLKILACLSYFVRLCLLYGSKGDAGNRSYPELSGKRLGITLFLLLGSSPVTWIGAKKNFFHFDVQFITCEGDWEPELPYTA